VNAERGTRNAEWNADEPYALCSNPKPETRNSKRFGGFTLLEVMIAMFVFFIVVFAVLGMVVQSLGAARALQRPQPDFSILASALTLSNVLEEGCESGDFGELGDEYRDYDWERCIEEYATNGLYRVRFVITRRDTKSQVAGEDMEILMYRPGKPNVPGSVRRP
jgi:hypothetical protein